MFSGIFYTIIWGFCATYSPSGYSCVNAFHVHQQELTVRCAIQNTLFCVINHCNHISHNQHTINVWAVYFGVLSIFLELCVKHLICNCIQNTLFSSWPSYFIWVIIQLVLWLSLGRFISYSSSSHFHLTRVILSIILCGTFVALLL